MQALKFAKEAARGREPGALALLATVYAELHGQQMEGVQCVEAALQQDPWHMGAAVAKAKLLCYVSLPCIAVYTSRLLGEQCAREDLHELWRVRFELLGANKITVASEAL